MSGVKYFKNGKEVTREEFTQGGDPNWLKSSAMTSSTYTEHDPLISEGCGVMKSQIQETREAIKYHGIQGAAVHNNGQIRFTSRRARKEFLAMRGLVDNDAGYAD